MSLGDVTTSLVPAIKSVYVGTGIPGACWCHRRISRLNVFGGQIFMFGPLDVVGKVLLNYFLGAPCEPKKGTATKILGKTWNQMRQKIPEIAFWRFPYFSLPLIWGGIHNRLRCQVNFNSQTHFSQ